MELEYRNPAQIGQLNSLFHAITDVVNRAGAQQITDWSMSNSHFSPNACTSLLSIKYCQFYQLHFVTSLVVFFCNK